MSNKFDKLAELAKELPAVYKENAIALVERMGEVIEGLGDKPTEWKAPTLKLTQATTDRSKLPKGATIGSLILGEHIVKPPLKAVPMRVYITRQMWNPDPAAATMVCSSPDGITGFRYGACKTCPHAVFDEVEKKTACNKTITVISVAEDLSNVFITNFSKTNYSSGMDWQGLMKKAGVSPYKRIYEISSMTSPKVKNVEILKVEPVTTHNSVNADVLPFIEELFRLVSADRTGSLEQFYEYIENKKDASLLLNNTEEDSASNVTLITAAEAATPAATGSYKL